MAKAISVAQAKDFARNVMIDVGHAPEAQQIVLHVLMIVIYQTTLV